MVEGVLEVEVEGEGEGEEKGKESGSTWDWKEKIHRATVYLKDKCRC